MRFTDTSEFLTEYIPQQKTFRRQFRYCLPKTFSNPSRHWLNPEAFAFSEAYFETLGHCPQRARRILTDTGLVEFEGDFAEGYCRQAIPTPLFHKIYAAMQSERFAVCNVNTNRKARKRPETVTVDGVQIEGECPIDLMALQHFILSGYQDCKKPDGNPVSDPLVWRDYAIAFQQYAIALNGPYGSIPQFFEVSPKTNRIHGVGLTIQNMHRDLRTALLNGCYTADINNCFFSILSQLGKYPAVRDYADNPKGTRQTIAADVGVSYEQVKICLLAMLNGAAVQGDALLMHLGSYEAVQSFWYHPTVTAIRRDCLQARHDRGFDNAKQFASFLMKEEQKVARVMAQGTRLVLPLHDGVVTRERLDETELEARIKTMTGYRTTITTKRYNYELSGIQSPRQEGRDCILEAA